MKRLITILVLLQVVSEKIIAQTNTVTGNNAGINLTTGVRNTFTGANSGQANTTKNNNSFYGYNSGTESVLGYENTFLGCYSGQNDSDGYRNTFVGIESGSSNISGSINVYVGDKSGLNANGNYNVGIGSLALGGGDLSGVGNISPTAASNTAIGYMSGRWANTGGNNTFIGAWAGGLDNGGYQSLENSSAIGHKARFSESNQISFGDTNVTTWIFGRHNIDASLNGKTLALQVGSTGTTNKNGNGAGLTKGGEWENASDENLKANITELVGGDILNKINQLKITRWMYKGTNGEYHIGPMAQQFYSLFNVGTTNLRIGTIDPAGVALVGIQELSRRVATLEDRVEELSIQLAKASAKNGKAANTSSFLFQNNPNPFSENTLIKYFIEPGSRDAKIAVYDINGRLIRNYQIVQGGDGQLQIAAGELQPGSYIYVLSDSKSLIDSKVMIVLSNR